MKLVIGSDHAGFELKEKLKKFLLGLSHDVTDFGCASPDPVDYPDVALLVGEAVAGRQFDRGVLLDGFGGAVALVANKIPRVRAVCAYDALSARFAAAHEDANVLCLGGKTLGELTAQELLRIWLETAFEGGRHDRRLAKLNAIEKNFLKVP